MNVNQLFPRLSIRTKLTIAFILLAVIPLGAIASLGVHHTVIQVRALARSALENDLAVARAQTERALREVEGDIAHLASNVLGPLFPRSTPQEWAAAGLSVSNLLSFKPAIYQVKVIDAQGRLILIARATGSKLAREDPGEGLYYALRAGGLKAGQRELLPVELRLDAKAGQSLVTLPAIAILSAVRDSGGVVSGVVVGEVRAADLFAPLDAASRHLGGVTGLVDSDGLYLYHSAHKRDWANLLASRSQVDIRSEVAGHVVDAMLRGDVAGTMRSADEQIVSFVPLPLADAGLRPLVLYGVVPSSALEAGVRDFLSLVGLGGAAVLALVVGLATLAAHQLTQPIYQLRQWTRRLAQGEWEEEPDISSNDELEDLAHDFSIMSTTLAEQRHNLEELVRERTHALSEAHAELAGILENSADAIIGLDLDGRVRVWNKGAKSLFGYSASEARGRDIDELLLPPGGRWQAEASYIRREALERGALVNHQTRRLNREGAENPVGLTQSVICNEKGEPRGYSLILRDTRMQAKLENQMRRSESLAAVSVMAAGLAHELGNPLAILGNRIECMEREVSARGEGEFLAADLAVLRDHTRRLDSLIRDLLKLAHERGDEDGPVDLNAVASKVVALLERTCAARDVTLKSELAESLPTLTGSGKNMETVCVNLLMNALDATPPGGTVTLRTRECSPRGTIDLEVEDTGHGVPPELRHRVFEPFFTTKKTGRGTGLGLAVCRDIVARHGGSIRVESQVGRGSRFIVHIPLSRFESPWSISAS